MASQSDLMARLTQYLQAQAPLLQPARGGVLWQLLTAVTQGASDTQAKIDAAAAQALLSTAGGAYLAALAADRGIYRKPAVSAAAPGVFTRTPADPNNALTIPALTPLSTTPAPGAAPVAFYTLTAATIPAGQTASNSVTAQATVGGAAGNVGSGLINLVQQGPPGVTFSNTAAASGGADAESDSALRNRAQLAIAPANTPAQIAAAALAVPGIYAAVVVDAQDGLGDYTVYASDQSGNLSGALNSAVLSAVAAIDGIGLTRHVAALTVLSQAVAANVAIASGYVWATVAGQVQAAVAAYVGALAAGQVLHPSDLTQVVFGSMPGYAAVPGVVAFYPTTPAAAVVPTATQLVRLSGSATLTQVAN